MPEKKIPMSPEMAKAVKKQSEAKIDEAWEGVLDAARRANIRPEILYAMRKTGRIVTVENKQYLTPEELAEWNAAIDDFKAMN